MPGQVHACGYAGQQYEDHETCQQQPHPERGLPDIRAVDYWPSS